MDSFKGFKSLNKQGALYFFCMSVLLFMDTLGVCAPVESKYDLEITVQISKPVEDKEKKSENPAYVCVHRGECVLGKVTKSREYAKDGMVIIKLPNWVRRNRFSFREGDIHSFTYKTVSKDQNPPLLSAFEMLLKDALPDPASK